MAITQVIDQPIQRVRGIAALTGLQDVVSTDANRRAINARAGYHEILVTGTVLWRLGFCPKILYVYHNDDSTDEWIDLLAPTGSPRTRNAIIDSGQTQVQFVTLAAADQFYIATTDRVGGFRWDLTAFNATGSAALTAQHSSSGGFTTSAITDGTDTGSTTPFAQDGNMTWDTLPDEDAWIPVNLKDVLPSTTVPAAVSTQKHYWTRLSPLVSLDNFSIVNLITLLQVVDNDAGDADALRLQATTEYTIDVHDDVGALEFWTEGANTTITWNWIYR